ncbi:unnamed protein product [Musa textilis]
MEEWLIEAGLCPAPRDMVNLKGVWGMLHASSTPPPCPRAEPSSRNLDQPRNAEPDRPWKNQRSGHRRCPSQSWLGRPPSKQVVSLASAKLMRPRRVFTGRSALEGGSRPRRLVLHQCGCRMPVR